MEENDLECSFMMDALTFSLFGYALDTIVLLENNTY